MEKKRKKEKQFYIEPRDIHAIMIDAFLCVFALCYGYT